MDGIFNKTNTSMYNIYDKCYKTQNTTEGLKYINTGCEDDVGIMTFLNDQNMRKNWNIKTEKEWTPCNKKIIMEYQGSRNVYDILPFILQRKLRVVNLTIFSGSILEILIQVFL